MNVAELIEELEQHPKHLEVQLVVYSSNEEDECQFRYSLDYIKRGQVASEHFVGLHG